MDSIAPRMATAAPDGHRRCLLLRLGLMFVVPLLGPLQTANAQCVESDILKSTRTPSDGQGSAVAVSGNVVLIGSPQRNNAGQGYVNFFRYDGRSWVEEAYQPPHDLDHGGPFGAAVAVDGDVAVIGAARHGHDRVSSPSGAVFVYRFDHSTCFSRRSGAAFVFRDDGSRGWTCEATLTPPVLNNPFGRAVAIDGRVAIVAGVVPGPSPSGAVWAYERRGGVWGPRICELIGSDLGGVVESFGVSVDLHRDRAVAGATPITSVGGAYVFDGMADGIPESCEPCSFTCPWDLDCDGDVDVSDFIMLIRVWGFDFCGPADFDGDGNVGMVDLLALLANWGTCPPRDRATTIK